MFEYLMPHLLMPSYPNTLLHETCAGVVRHQAEYGRLRSVPWGVSESGYNLRDTHQNYQYRAFGVPGLGLQRGLADELVIAPYASALALLVAPHMACDNLQRLSREHREGDFGFYESVDYTPGRLPPNQTSVAVRSYMAHHQGMIFLSILSTLRQQPMQRRFGSYPVLRAADLLLQEKLLRTGVDVYSPELDYEESIRKPSTEEGEQAVMQGPHSGSPEIHLLSNGHYHVAISRAGSGFSRWKNLDVTRWREDGTRDCWGYFIYLRDSDTRQFWSMGYQPTRSSVDHYEAIFSLGRAEFRQRHQGLSIHMEITVAPEDDVEIRRVSMTNHTQEVRTLEVTSYAEVVLSPGASDISHPAFGNLFVLSHQDPETGTLFCHRRGPEGPEDTPYLLHLVTGAGGGSGQQTYETDRSRFHGRGSTMANPGAMRGPYELSETTGSVLDPIVSLRRKVILNPGEKAVLVFVLGMADTRTAAHHLASKYTNHRMADRAFELSWTQSEVALRQLDATRQEASLYSRLAGALIYANQGYRADQRILRRNRRGQSSLWAYGISGDVPIVLLRIGHISQIGIVRQLVKAYAFWRLKGLTVELVIVNEDESPYRQSLHDAIINAVVFGGEGGMTDKPGGILVRRHEQIADENLVLLQSVARIDLDASRGSLADQVHHSLIPNRIPLASQKILQRTRIYTSPQDPPIPTQFHNGLGGFSMDGQEYIITLHPHQNTPRPWVNVIANPFFGTVISESGSAYTWIENAREFRITPWSNDAVLDPSGETFYIRDDETGHYWSPTPQPTRGTGTYTIRHGFGYSKFEYTEQGISSELTVFVTMDAPVKFSVLRVRNLSGRTRSLSVVGYVEWMLTDQRGQSLMHTQTEVDLRTGALLARNPYNSEFPDRIAYLDVNYPTCSQTGDRREFIGRNQSLEKPAALSYMSLTGTVGAGLDPCGAVMVPIELAEDAERRVIFRLGVGRSTDDVHELIERYRKPGSADKALHEVHDFWDETLGVVRVETPSTGVNILTNGWLLYQTLSCRMWGRSGFYQSGGAFGFRDQLQDSMALVTAQPKIARAHILLASAHQFQEGDVQHWWHPPSGRGVRTHISDDFLWLAAVTCHYVTTTADSSILDEVIPYLEGRPLREDEEDYYDMPIASGEVGSLYQHCVRAIEHGMRFGPHGLPLMGSGDWNDGMNKIGNLGRGESVWLGFFFYRVLTDFSKVAQAQNDPAMAQRCLTTAQTLKENLERHGWDQEWYLRAFHDNGEPVGSRNSVECKLDSLSQSWSVISTAGDPERSRLAMKAVERILIRPDDQLIKLFDPPFDHSPNYPGYIQSYVPGVRENGGQYTHGAIWTVIAIALLGDHDRAWELFEMLSPINHTRDPEAVATYGAEPFVMAADIYSVAPHVGRAGWTWYTGSAAYMYRLALETLLGLNREGNYLRITPRLPSTWSTVTINYRHGGARYRIILTGSAPNDLRPMRVTLDGVVMPENGLTLTDDGQQHAVQVEPQP